MSIGNTIRIILSGDSSQLDQATKRAQAGLKDLAGSADGAVGPSDRLGGAIQRVGHYAVGAFAVDRVATFAKAVFDASAEAQRLTTTLNFASGGKAPQEIAYLRDLTDRLGLGFTDAARAYAQFSAAARGTSLAGQGAKDIFEAVAKASATMGLSADATSGALLALQQMVSKGVVQAEELRGQLGERLPGAFGAAARAMGVTQAELGKMLERGEVLATDLLPKLAKVLNDDFAAAAESAATRLDASVNKMDNAWQRLKQRIGGAGVADAMSGLARAAANDMSAVAEAMALAEKSGRSVFGQWDAGLAMLAGRAFGLQVFVDRFNSIGTQAANAATNVRGLSDRLAELNRHGVTRPDWERDLSAARLEFDRLTRLQQSLSGDDGSAGSDRKFTRGGERALADQAAAEGRKAALDKLRETAKLDLDIRREWSDEAVKIAKAFNSEISAGGDPGGSLAAERDRKLIELARTSNKKIKEMALAQGADVRALSDANLTLSLQQQENRIDVVTRGLQREREATEKEHEAGLIGLALYIERKHQLDTRLLDQEQASLLAQHAAEQQRSVTDEPGRRLREAKLEDLRGKLAANAEARGAEAVAFARAPAEPAQTAFRLSEIGRDNLGGADERKAWVDRIEAATKSVQEIEAANREAGIAMIRDDRERGDAQIALERERLLAQIEPLRELPDRYAKAYAAVNDAVSLKTQQLTELLKPEWQRMAEAWADSTRLMQESGMTVMRGIEGAIDQLVTTGKINFKGLVASILADLAKLQLKNMAGNLLTALLGSGGGGGPQLLGEAGGYGPRAAGGPVSAGGTYLIGERGPELLHMGAMGGNITPNNRLGGSTSITLAPNIYIDSRSDAGQVAQMVAMGIAQSQQQMWEQLRLRGAV